MSTVDFATSPAAARESRLDRLVKSRPTLVLFSALLRRHASNEVPPRTPGVGRSASSAELFFLAASGRDPEDCRRRRPARNEKKFKYQLTFRQEKINGVFFACIYRLNQNWSSLSSASIWWPDLIPRIDRGAQFQGSRCRSDSGPTPRTPLSACCRIHST